MYALFSYRVCSSRSFLVQLASVLSLLCCTSYGEFGRPNTERLVIPYIIPVSSYVHYAPAPPAVALLESEDVLGHFFSGLSNVQFCADAYMYDKSIRSENQNVKIYFMNINKIKNS